MPADKPSEAAPTPAAGSPQLEMKRHSLADLPELKLPRGCQLRHFEPGDAPHWNRIIAESFGWEDEPRNHFEELMRSDPAFRPERVWFLCRRGKPVATASAWQEPTRNPSWGTLHFVGVLPSAGGRGLGYVTCLAALHQMAREDRSQACLKTDDDRLPAIRLYLKLGFEPWVVHRNQPTRWRKVFRALGRPELSRHFRETLREPPAEPVQPAPNEGAADHYGYRRLYRHNAGRPARGGLRGGGDPGFLADEWLYRPSRLGTASITPPEAQAGSPLGPGFALAYTAGPEGLPTGAVVRFAIRGQHPLGFAGQTTAPDKRGFVKLEGPRGVTLEHPKPGDWLAFRLKQGSLKLGDTIRIRVTRPRGLRWNSVAGRRIFYPTLRLHPDEPTCRLPEPLTLDLVPGLPVRLALTLPATSPPGAVIPVRLTVRDRYDNRVPTAGEATLQAGDRKSAVMLAGGIGEGAVRAGKRAALRATASMRKLKLKAESNPSIPREDLQCFFGDLHCHDFLSEAEGYTDDVYRFAREDRALDFFSLAVQSHGWHSEEKHALHKYFNERFHEEGRFITLLAFEWQHSAFGDKVVHYLGGDAPYLPVEDARYRHPRGLYAALAQSDALVISHHVGYPLPGWVPGTDWSVVDDRIERCVEIWSNHGSSEGYDGDDRPLSACDPNHTAYAALRRGLRLGFVAGSDSHSGRPGGSAREPGGHWGGLTGAWAPALSRRGIFGALRQRHTFALTRARIVLHMTVNGVLMGGEAPTAERARIRIEVWTPGTLARVEILKNTRCVRTIEPKGDHVRLEWEDLTGGPAYYHCRVTQTDGELAVGSPVWVG